MEIPEREVIVRVRQVHKPKWFMEVSDREGTVKEVIGPFEKQSDAWDAVKEHANNSTGQFLRYRAVQLYFKPQARKPRRARAI